jgi:hypothetical protein
MTSSTTTIDTFPLMLKGKSPNKPINIYGKVSVPSALRKTS